MFYSHFCFCALCDDVRLSVLLHLSALPLLPQELSQCALPISTVRDMNCLSKEISKAPLHSHTALRTDIATSLLTPGSAHTILCHLRKGCFLI